MRFRPALVGILLLLVVSGAVVAAGTTRSDGVGSTATVDSTGFERADPGLVVTVQLREDGDARWHVTHRFLVNGTNETRAFDRFVDDVRSGDRDLGVGRDTFARFAAAASETTDREMQIRNANWTESTVENGTGTVTYSFTWTNFGRVEDDSLFVGDAFQSPEGTWFPRLYDGQRLVIRPPEGLNIVGTPPDKGLDQRALVWDGYREFEPGYLSVALERPSDPTTTTTSVNTSTAEPVQPDDSFLLGVGFALLLVFVGAGSYFFARWQTQQDDGDDAGGVPEASDGGSPPGGGGTADAGSATAAGSDAASTPPDADATGSSASTAEPDVGDATGGATAAAGSAGATVDDAESDDGIDEALLSDEERVLRLLEGNGGRMKQANIVTETGWSNAKVSQLLSGMHDDDEIQKLRIGRENLIALPEENVADFGDDE
ncbi:hypothetical protein [Halorubellus sp. PRR65]|uniref:helix-turn-helix transcriptional regulator n=1 Tax=Halorubellus sp. PRR65 TaxID=3098148 RepID=UPI002B259C8F|nr:hypothetical protein [Halorubellus sp. PRR65]